MGCETSSLRALTGLVQQRTYSVRRGSSRPGVTPMSNHASNRARERRLRIPGGLRLWGDGMARAVRLRMERLRNRGATRVRSADARARARVPAARARIWWLADRAGAVCDAAGTVGRRGARGVPRCRRAVPARDGAPRRVAAHAD